MTDRYNALVVVLEQDTRSDDAEQTINAIRQIKGVLSVTPQISTSDDWIATERVRLDMRQKLWDALK